MLKKKKCSVSLAMQFFPGILYTVQTNAHPESGYCSEHFAFNIFQVININVKLQFPIVPLYIYSAGVFAPFWFYSRASTRSILANAKADYKLLYSRLISFMSSISQELRFLNHSTSDYRMNVHPSSNFPTRTELSGVW